MMTAFERAWDILKRVVLPESSEPFGPDMLMWHLGQRFVDPKTGKKRLTAENTGPNSSWEAMPRPKARTTHGFTGNPIPEDILANPPVNAGPDMTEVSDEDWQRMIQMRMGDDENAKARLEWHGLKPSMSLGER